MKKMMTLAVMMTIAISATAMTYNEARSEALFLSDKMAYELGLNSAQYDAVYEINFDYFYSVNNRYDISGSYWSRRNMDLSYVLTPYQYSLYTTLSYFYRPIDWYNGAWRFTVYHRYANRHHFFRSHPTVYVSYRGGRNHHAHSYYAGRFDRPAPPHHGNHPNMHHHDNHAPKPAGNHNHAPKPAGNHNHAPKPAGNHNHGGVSGHNHQPAHNNNHSTTHGRPTVSNHSAAPSRPAHRGAAPVRAVHQ